ncbi:hypothetical protein SEA_ROYALG_105 [Gordonia phage RoyalG]|uniref:Uncharacterized protein n=1 Tax=Gordonia phage RoyalG TaxID=2805837 RepID=A0A890USC6_9CAUD|nr:hypothetical protein SEA_ROYALG_105 [Gordonia phage RoyalG]
MKGRTMFTMSDDSRYRMTIRDDIDRCVVVDLTRHRTGEWEEAQLWIDDDGIVVSDMDASGIMANLVGDRQEF